MTEYKVSVRFKKNKFPCLHNLMKCAAHFFFFFQISLFHRTFRFTKFYLYQHMHLFLSYTKIT